MKNILTKAQMNFVMVNQKQKIRIVNFEIK